MIIQLGRRLLTLLVTLVLAWPSLANDTAIRLADTHNLFPSPDALLAKTLQEVRASRLDTALNNVNQLISMRPDFRLAHLIRGDLLLARARPLSTMGEAARGSQASLTDLREEARARLLRYLDQPEEGYLPKQVLQLAPEHKYVLLADASRARLYVFENVNGVPRLVRDYYMTIGRNGTDKQVEGDKKTPIGVYTISQHLPRQRLTDFYGAGAYPLNYPNEWDRLHGRSGHGIWIHGTPPNTYSRPPRASDGCVVLANPDLSDLGRYIEVGRTPIVIADRTEWVDPVSWEMHRQEILTVLDLWRTDWEAREVPRFLRHYAPDMLDKTWATNKRRNIENKAWIRVGLSDVSVFLYPDARLAVTTFTQAYSSDSFSNSTSKRLYWRLDDGQWRIALEHSLPSNTQLAARGR
jgi:lipoprotein-anchoring transpeptidase ErfK/SrfK